MLRHRLAVAVSAAALSALATGAFAADLPAYEPAPSIAVPSFTWTGAYVGVQAGYGWGDSKSRALGGSVKTSPDGFVIGGYAGYNYQFDGSPVVIGIETDFNYSDADDKRTVFGFRGRNEVNWTGATRARLGYAFDRFLVYGAAGVAYADRELRVAGVGKDSKTAIGWTVGGGVESAVTDNVVVRAEYRYSDFGKDKFRIAGVRASSDYTEHRVMAGVAYKFGW
ncbi:outer membrane protein [Methylopila sp. Yamaguchi]|uniref:outer membrane protein n=1 Tax=Methylopila sp. Yamaguchi TaxID=1437817 RepID=UPI000CCAABFC|nr:outer membrane protein [Methylopila sp. Yamaguchi]GBD48469.1 outer-membrane immunogenic protein [Methylopila sp. Yamaguchi]